MSRRSVPGYGFFNIASARASLTLRQPRSPLRAPLRAIFCLEGQLMARRDRRWSPIDERTREIRRRNEPLFAYGGRQSALTSFYSTR